MATKIVVRTADKRDELAGDGWLISDSGVLTVKSGTEFLASYAPGHWFNVQKIAD